MLVSKNCKLVLTDLFFYDFKSCYYNILKSIDFDLSQIDFENKEKRNIQLGLLQKNNPNLSNFLIETSQNLVSFYLHKNNIHEDDIILRQKDGVILRKKLINLNETIPLDLRDIISKMIITINRNQYLTINYKGIVEVKGLSNKPVDISFYNLFRNLNYSNTKQLFHSIDNIRTSILDSQNIFWFIRQIDDDYHIPIINEGIIKISKSMVKFININEIDRTFIWKDFVWQFAESCLIHYAMMKKG